MNKEDESDPDDPMMWTKDEDQDEDEGEDGFRTKRLSLTFYARAFTKRSLPGVEKGGTAVVANSVGGTLYVLALNVYRRGGESSVEKEHVVQQSVVSVRSLPPPPRRASERAPRR